MWKRIGASLGVVGVLVALGLSVPGRAVAAEAPIGRQLAQIQVLVGQAVGHASAGRVAAEAAKREVEGLRDEFIDTWRWAGGADTKAGKAWEHAVSAASAGTLAKAASDAAKTAAESALSKLTGIDPLIRDAWRWAAGGDTKAGKAWEHAVEATSAGRLAQQAADGARAAVEESKTAILRAISALSAAGDSGVSSEAIVRHLSQLTDRISSDNCKARTPSGAWFALEVRDRECEASREDLRQSAALVRDKLAEIAAADSKMMESVRQSVRETTAQLLRNGNQNKTTLDQMKADLLEGLSRVTQAVKAGQAREMLEGLNDYLARVNAEPCRERDRDGNPWWGSHQPGAVRIDDNCEQTRRDARESAERIAQEFQRVIEQQEAMRELTRRVSEQMHEAARRAAEQQQRQAEEHKRQLTEVIRELKRIHEQQKSQGQSSQPGPFTPGNTGMPRMGGWARVGQCVAPPAGGSCNDSFSLELFKGFTIQPLKGACSMESTIKFWAGIAGGMLILGCAILAGRWIMSAIGLQAPGNGPTS